MQTWRSLLDPDGCLYVQKADVQRACAQVGWRGDVSVLWSALDASNGRAALEEFGFKDSKGQNGCGPVLDYSNLQIPTVTPR